MAEERYAGSALYQAVMRHLQMPSRAITRSVYVSTLPTQIVLPNARRIGYAIVNCNFESCLIGFSSDVNVNNGFVLAPGGGTVTVDYIEDGELAGYEVWARFLESDGYVFIVEVIAL